MEMLTKNETQLISGGATNVYLDFALEDFTLDQLPTVMGAIEELKKEGFNTDQFLQTLENAGIRTENHTFRVFYSTNFQP